VQERPASREARTSQFNFCLHFIVGIYSNSSSSTSITALPFILTFVSIPIAASIFARLIASWFDHPLPRSLTIRFLSSLQDHSIFNASTGRYLSTMSYEFSNKCLVCPREHDATPYTNCECSHYCSNESKVVDLPIHRTLCKSFVQLETVPDIDKWRHLFPGRWSQS
jgi:hypothetical protein